MSDEQPAYQDRDTLRRLYYDEGLTQAEIGEELGCTRTNVSYWMDRHGIAPSDTTICPWQDRETLRRLYYDEGLSQPEIGDRLGCSDDTVRRWMKRHGIDPGMGHPHTSDTLSGKLSRTDPDEIGVFAPEGDDNWKGYYDEQRVSR